MVKPIRPEDAVKLQANSIPPVIVQIFNDFIVKNLRNSPACIEATVMLDDVVSVAAKELQISRQEIFDNHWMDVEPIFRHEGWTVKFDQPAYCESYKAFYVFSKKK